MTDDAARTGHAAHGGPVGPGPDRRGGDVAVRAAAGLAVAGLVAAGIAGSVAPASAATDPADHVVSVSGDPLVHTFDTEVPGDAVSGTWTVRSTSTTPVDFTGILRADVPDPLAEALTVQYGEVDADGGVAAWHDAGTLADPVGYATAVRDAGPVSAARTVTIPVRVALPDPSALEGEAGETLRVTATFTVSHLRSPGDDGTPAVTDPGAPGPVAPGQAGPGAAGPGDPGVLALTGPAGWLALVATALLALGLAARRRPTRAAHPVPAVTRHP